jgi:hypothetical protein
MFDFRYHALSLAAVFIALVVGLLLGAAIGDKSVFTKAEQLKYNRALASAASGRTTISQLNSELSLREQYENDVYPTLVADELVGERIGVIFLGQDNNQIDQYVQTALAPSGATVQYDVVVREPLELSNIAAAASAVPGYAREAALATDTTLLAPFAKRVASDLVSERDGGPLVHAIETSLFSSYSGALDPVAAVVLVRDEPSLPTPLSAQTATFESSLAAGLSASGIPVVGVQLTDTTPSQVPWYSSQQLTSVNDVDDIAGRTALVYALAGARGSYGIGSGAQSLLPGTLPTGTPSGK